MPQNTELTMKATSHSAASGLVIDQTPARKSFHLNDLLCLTTGLMLAKEGAAALHRLVAYVMEEEASVRNTAINAVAAKKCVEEQLPFLKDINVASLYSIYGYKPAGENPYLSVWRDMQALRYGAEHYIIPYSRWQKRQNSHKLPPLPANSDNAATAKG